MKNRLLLKINIEEGIMAYQTNNLVYHYTSLEVLLKLLDNIKDRKIIFHASYIPYMNDTKEFYYGFYQVMKLIPQIENELFVENNERLSHFWNNDELRYEHLEMLSKNFRLPFVVCFCNSRDSLPQWGMYGDRGKGLSLGFDLQDYYRIVNYKGTPTLDMTHIDDGKLRAIRLSYKNISKRHLFKNAVYLHYQYYLKRIKDIKNGEEKCKFKWQVLTEIAFHLSPLIKHKAYAYELESRIIYPCNRMEDIKFKTNSANQLIPYAEVGIETERFKKIVIGPSCEFESTKIMLETKIKQLGLEHVKILQSKIPFRA